MEKDPLLRDLRRAEIASYLNYFISAVIIGLFIIVIKLIQWIF